MDEGLDLVGETLILGRDGHGHLQPEFEGEGLPLAVDGTEGDGSLEVVGIAHGETPYWNYGGSSCVFSSIRPPKSLGWSPCGSQGLENKKLSRTLLVPH